MATVGRLAEDMQGQGGAIVLVGGDLIDGRGQNVTGLNAQYAKWIEAMAPVYDAAIPVYAVPGNHEYWCDTAENCVTAWTETMVPMLPSGRTDNVSSPGREYSFTFNNAFFIGLDQNQFGSSFPRHSSRDGVSLTHSNKFR
jgi:predicted MPP superfamily phosphohydrolase